MKKTLLVVAILMSSVSFANESDNAQNYCSDIIKRRPEGSCAVKACKKGLLCDYDCTEKHQDSSTKWESCREKCWDMAVEQMKKCG